MGQVVDLAAEYQRGKIGNITVVNGQGLELDLVSKEGVGVERHLNACLAHLGRIDVVRTTGVHQGGAEGVEVCNKVLPLLAGGIETLLDQLGGLLCIASIRQGIDNGLAQHIADKQRSGALDAEFHLCVRNNRHIAYVRPCRVAYQAIDIEGGPDILGCHLLAGKPLGIAAQVHRHDS
ncbi:hypothetical protein DSECCO2_525990 [anaerobic digester metagenome]